MTSRRGFTLVELLVSMMLLIVVLGGMYRMLNSSQRITRAQAERVDMQSNMRAGALILAAELREVGYDSMPSLGGNTNVPDIQMATGDSIRFRAIRGTGIICKINGTAVTISTTVGYSKLRSMTTNDSLLIFVEGDPSTAQDDRWIARGISNISAESSSDCATSPTWPWADRTGFTVTIPSWTASNVIVGNGTSVNDNSVTAASVTVGSPVKFFEVMRYGIYQDGGKDVLGAESLTSGGGMQPIAGPLASGGFHLSYHDSTGAAITPSTQDARSRIRTIRISMIAASDQNLSSSGSSAPAQVVDSIATTVALRNSLARN